jgi:hypothetical protein
MPASSYIRRALGRPSGWGKPLRLAAKACLGAR